MTNSLMPQSLSRCPQTWILIHLILLTRLTPAFHHRRLGCQGPA